MAILCDLASLREPILRIPLYFARQGVKNGRIVVGEAALVAFLFHSDFRPLDICQAPLGNCFQN